MKVDPLCVQVLGSGDGKPRQSLQQDRGLRRRDPVLPHGLEERREPFQVAPNLRVHQQLRQEARESAEDLCSTTMLPPARHDLQHFPLVYNWFCTELPLCYNHVATYLTRCYHFVHHFCTTSLQLGYHYIPTMVRGLLPDLPLLARLNRRKVKQRKAKQLTTNQITLMPQQLLEVALG